MLHCTVVASPDILMVIVGDVWALDADSGGGVWALHADSSGVPSASRALPTETKVESGTSQSKSGTSVNLSDIGKCGVAGAAKEEERGGGPRRCLPLFKDWYFIADQPAPAPHLEHPEGCAALRFF